MAERLDIKALQSQMDDEVGEITRLQKEFLKSAEEIEERKDRVNKLDGAIWALRMERDSADSNGISEVATTAD